MQTLQLRHSVKHIQLASTALLSPQDYISRTQTGDEANQPDVVNMLFAGGHSGTFQVLMLVLHVVSEWHADVDGGNVPFTTEHTLRTFRYGGW